MIDLVDRLYDRALDTGRGLVERRLRLGVTGLAEAGKTVFITALVQALLHPSALPRFSVVAQGRLRTVLLRPQPSQDLPRFPFEECVARLTGALGKPDWPESTRTQAELRLSLRYIPGGLMAYLGERLLHLDLFDYPGEWLLDLALLNQTYESWSRATLAEIRAASPQPEAAAYLDHLHRLAPDQEDSQAEVQAIDSARLFTAFLQARQRKLGRSAPLGPGRFLLPGELEGSPLLTFAPLGPEGGKPAARGSLRRLMAERFQAYQDRVVKAFHQRHFTRLDRQILLIDLAGHLSQEEARADAAAQALDAVLSALKIGGSSWLPRWLAPRIDRVLFAATKADHLPGDQHPALEEQLRRKLDASLRRTAYAGARLETMALASIRATREVDARGVGHRYVAGQPYGRDQALAHYPGKIPQTGPIASGSFRIERFRPPDNLDPRGPWPHLGLDRALEFLVGDWLE